MAIPHFNKKMRILSLSFMDRGGGAEKVALNLHEFYRRIGHEARLLVRYKFAQSEDTFEINPYAYTSSWGPYWAQMEKFVRRFPKFYGKYRIVDWIRRVAWPKRWLDSWRGIEDYNYPYSHYLVDHDGWLPDVIHAHNLHGDYFDLGALPNISREIPVIWTLHDTWALTGHCGYFLGCNGWLIGCGNCPDLRRPPALLRDGTSENWKRKKQIYATSKLAIATPSRWLMDKVDRSMLCPWQRRVIPNGVNFDIYKPGERGQARRALNLPANSLICVFISFSGSNPNPYKDYATVEQAVKRVSKLLSSAEIYFVCIGGEKRDSSDSRWRYVGYLSDPYEVSLYYQAADLLLHAAHAEAFGKIVTEAMACGLPVVATAVGGISEQIKEGATGFLVPHGNSELMAHRIIQLKERPELCRNMGMAATAHARHAFNLEAQGEAYLQWFNELLTIYHH